MLYNHCGAFQIGRVARNHYICRLTILRRCGGGSTGCNRHLRLRRAADRSLTLFTQTWFGTTTITTRRTSTVKDVDDGKRNNNQNVHRKDNNIVNHGSNDSDIPTSTANNNGLPLSSLPENPSSTTTTITNPHNYDHQHLPNPPIVNTVAAITTADPTLTATTITESETRDPYWMERFVPPSYRPYAYLARWDKPIGTMLLVRKVCHCFLLSSLHTSLTWG